MPPVDPEFLASRPRQSERVVARATGDTVVILDTDSGGYFSLDGVASSVWGLCAGELTVGEIVERISAEYEATPEAVQADVIAFVEELAGEKLVRL